MSTELGKGFIGRGHFKLRFSDLDEALFLRLLLGKVSSPAAAQVETIEFSLLDLFPAFPTIDALAAHLDGHDVRTTSKLSEIAADALTAVMGGPIDAPESVEPALHFYNDFLDIKLGFLRNGDDAYVMPCLEDVNVDRSGRLYVFHVNVVPAKLVAELPKLLLRALEWQGQLVKTLAIRTSMPMAIRIDYRYQLDALKSALEARQAATGEAAFAFDSSDLPFRHLMDEYPGGLLLAHPGTSDPSEKALLLPFLETTGDVDIERIHLISDPRDVMEVTIRYHLVRPTRGGIYSVAARGLSPELRAKMNEHELRVYYRVHDRLAKKYVFAGKPEFERSFSELAAWLIRKVAYCIEEPSFLAEKARTWLQQHRGDSYRQFEDGFFLPELYERLREAFGSRVVKKPERFRGEVDIEFDASLPTELKVREGPAITNEQAVDTKFPGAGQAAAYASISRLGFLAILDVPEDAGEITNLEQCVTVVERSFGPDDPYPTCVVVFCFHGHHPQPSSVR